MNSKNRTLTALQALTIPALCLSLSIHAADTNAGISRSSNHVVVDDQKTGTSARAIVGQDVQSTQGADLGEVKDLVVKTDNGKVVFALITSGGIAGIAETIRAVPFAAIQRARPTDGAITLDLKDAKWSTAPSMREDEVDLLTAAARGRSIFQYFGREWDDLRDVTDTNDKSAGRLVRVSEIIGQKVVQSGRDVGDIQDVVIDFNTRRGSVLLDPNNEFTGSHREFVIKFDQLSSSRNDDDAFTTTLTRADFARATPLDNEGWNNDAGFPYLWTGYGSTWTPSSSTAAAISSTESRVTGKPNVNVVRGALRSESSLPENARMATITQNGDKLVITGPVESEAFKQKVTKIVEQAAEGWTVENKMKISAAAE